MTQNEEFVIEFIRMIEQRHSEDELNKFYHPDIEQIEYPNAITKNVTSRNLNDLKIASEKGRKILSSEKCEIKNIYSSGDTVILESIWRGTLTVPLGNLPVGGEMKAYFVQIFEFKDGKIFRQRNYDCFEPFT